MPSYHGRLARAFASPGLRCEDAEMSTSTPAQPRWMTILGWILTILPSIMFIAGGVYAGFVNREQMKGGFKELDWPMDVAPYLIAAEIIGGLLYLFPKTSIL